MSHISLRAIGKTAAAICLAVAMSGVAMAGDAPDRVVMQSPAKDAAVLAKMQGLVNNRKAKTLSGLSRTINDGVVIRKSTIKDGKMNLNTATEQELSANPAVGPELAKGIVEFRENVGDIKSMDELLEVKGVTPEVLEKLKQAVTVEAIEGAECSC